MAAMYCLLVHCITHSYPLLDLIISPEDFLLVKQKLKVQQLGCMVVLCLSGSGGKQLLTTHSDGTAASAIFAMLPEMF